MIRLVLLVSLSISPSFVVNAQNLTPQERSFLGDNSQKYQNAYRYPQRRIESGSTSSTEITNTYLSQKVKRGATVVQSHTPTIEPAFELSELPQVEQIALPSEAPSETPASILPKPSNVVSNKVAAIANASAPIDAKSELLQQEESLKKAVEALREKKVAAAAKTEVVPEIATTAADVIKDPIPVKVQTEAVTPNPSVQIAPVVKEVAPESSGQVEELRALIDKLKQSRK